MKRKAVFWILALAICFVLAGAAYAVDGSTSGTTTFRVYAEDSKAYIRLTPEKGTAYVDHYSLAGFYTDSGEENRYGFYDVTVSGPGVSRTIQWAPSANILMNIRGDFEFDTVLEISFPSSGTYTVTVTPMSADVITSRFWVSDRFVRWVRNSTWRVSGDYHCSAFYHMDGEVYVHCYDDDGRLISGFTKTISQSGYISPPSFSGYEAASPDRYISFNTATGTCSPSSVDFYYRKTGGGGGGGGSGGGGSGGGSVTPYDWDTKFKEGVSTKNPKAYQQLYKLTDNDPGTVFSYYLYNSDKNNPMADFSAFFNNSTVRGIKIRNGDGGDYYRYMRVNLFHVVVYEGGRSYTERVRTVPDSLNYDYYSFDFDRTYHNVTRIDIYIDDRNVGQGEETNLVRIRDIAFY